MAGDLAARNYRFDEAVVLTRQAIAVDRHNARAQADLGMHLLRTGDETGARQALERAFKADPFDVVTFNLLSLLDSLDKFESVRDGSVLLRLDPTEAAILREYAGPLANRALSEMAARYQATPRTPILVEIFPRHDDFAVRTLGLPGLIGALGACFGRVVTLDSPRARPPGASLWGATLWHELAHVITLQLSRQRVPRWLTEGVSVYEEQRASPDWGREMEIPFAEARRRGRIMPLAELNAGFTDPEQIAIAYYEASLVVEHIVAAYGQEGLRKLLLAYGLGLEGDAALTGGLGVGIDTLQAGFDRMLDTRFAPLQKALEAPPGIADAGTRELEKIAAAHAGSYPVQLVLGERLWKAGRLDDALAALGRAAALVPMATGNRSPHADDGADRPPAGRQGAGRRRTRGAAGARPHRPRSGPATGGAAAGREPGPAGCGVRTASSHWIRSMPARTRRSDGSHSRARTTGPRLVSSAWRWLRVRATLRPPAATWPRATSWAATRPRPGARRSPPWRSRRVTSGPRSCS